LKSFTTAGTRKRGHKVQLLPFRSHQLNHLTLTLLAKSDPLAVEVAVGVYKGGSDVRMSENVLGSRKAKPGPLLSR